ncbi:hypothetical protein [Neorhizobium sp. NCHU2750]|uniref:hypothetical protein n=1 Tax=Neorhizobium sp. NCHU2750 TaxID=1825976 RepID=UPI0013C48F75
MSAPALIRKEDMRRAAEVAKETGCRIEIRIGDAVFVVDPTAPAAKESPIDYSRPSL